MIGEHGAVAVKNAKDSLRNAVLDEQEKSICGRYYEVEVIAHLKKIAADPFRPQFVRNNIQSLRNQILRLRKVMVPKEMPWRKRKLEQFLKDPPSASPGHVLLNKQDSTKLRRRQQSNVSSVSCVLNSFDSTIFRDERTFFGSHTSSSLTCEDALPEKQPSIVWTSQDYKVIWNDLAEDIPTIDTDESANGSDPSLENPSRNDARCVEISDTIHHSNSLSKGARKRHLQPSRQPIGLLNLIGDHLQTKVIPVGPSFQAVVPEWSGATNRSMLLLAYKNNSDNSKWLGTRVWPIKVRNMKTTGKTIGKGRPKSCSCAHPGSVGCIERHISEKRQLLQRDLGLAFFSWKFDEMGEQLSNMWSPKNQLKFESIVKMRPPSNGNDFMKRALKRFPKRNSRDLVNYYFNVYILRRMSQRTRLLSGKQVDTDDEDEVGDFNYLGVKERS